jgi:hypothetical protein
VTNSSLLHARVLARVSCLVLVVACFATGYRGAAQAKTPSINKLSADTAAPGTLLTITGENFFAPVSVRFGFVPATPESGGTATSISVRVPAMPVGPANVVVSVAGTDSNAAPFAVQCPAAGPCITSISPTTALPGDPVTIVGTTFDTKGAVKFGNTPADIISWSDKSITATVPGISAGSANVKVSVGGNDSPPIPFTAVTNILITMSPRVIQPANGKLPTSVNLGIFEQNCDDKTGVDLSKGGSAPYSIVITGGGLTPGSPSPSKCAVTSAITIDSSATSGTYRVMLVNKDKKLVASSELAVLDSSAGPIPPGLPPQVDVMWEVMSQNNCSDVFGRRIAQSEYCIQLVIGNNSGYPIQVAGIGFSSSLDPLFRGMPDVATSNSSYMSTRAILLEQNVTSVRNIVYNSLQAAGVLMAGFTPYFGTGKHPNGQVNNARLNWTTAASIVSGPVLSAFNIIAPNAVINQLKDLDDQSFRDNKIIANNSQTSITVFVEKMALTDALRASYIRLAGSGSACKGVKTTDIASIQLDQVNCDFQNTIKNSKNPDQYFPFTNAKGKLNPSLVKLALGKVVIVGNQIEYLQRVQIQSNSASQSASGPLGAIPQSLNFANVNGVTDGSPQPVTLANNGSTSLTNVTAQLSGTNSGDFTVKPSTCPSPMAQNATCGLSVTYAPTTAAGGAASRAATLQVSYSPGSTPLTISLTGAASDTVYFSSTGTLTPTATGATLTITNFKTGSINVVPSVDSTTGFTALANAACTSLANNKSCTITVAFASKAAAGPHNGTMIIKVTDSTSGATLIQQPINLTGTV